MTHTTHTTGILLLVGIGLLGLSWTASAQSFVGVAHSLDDNRILYEERHELTTNDAGQPLTETVRYVTPDGDLLAIKQMTYSELARPAYEIEHKTLDRTESVQPGPDGVQVRSKKTGSVEWPDQAAVIDGGFHYYILEHFDTLLAGETVSFQFLAPSRLTWTPLQIEPEAQDGRRLNLTLRLQNTLLNWILDPIHLVYDRESRRLLEYRGLTNLPRPDDGNYRARIIYSYDQEPS
ncbi:hypothetical protein [Saccharospirillum salsuginis]|uniref:Uncharacterized protein n=1 Tax=Saccharospirillum salsuginis TaxID=418750 RepID=A0A918KFT0_9GAMM|nr:hypothetical protein [Saccharospirillum salsuginis]GGX61003.1 hypothetical protein GCM10007392_31280 [Saccharospirillum salsuginis]